MIPGSDHDDAMPRPSHEGLYGTTWCSRCGFFGLGYNHPEWCVWQWLKESHQTQRHLDHVELGERVADAFGEKAASLV